MVCHWYDHRLDSNISHQEFEMQPCALRPAAKTNQILLVKITIFLSDRKTNSSWTCGNGIFLIQLLPHVVSDTVFQLCIFFLSHNFEPECDYFVKGYYLPSYLLIFCDNYYRIPRSLNSESEKEGHRQESVVGVLKQRYSAKNRCSLLGSWAFGTTASKEYKQTS